MTLSPILKVLSVFKKQKVEALLIGGQACIVYGAAEFSRDSDFVIMASPANLARLNQALAKLKAELIYFPQLTPEYLAKGHACHFRCHARGVEDLRVDIMGGLRGCEPFEQLWKRKKTVRINNVGALDILSLRDLVQSKKTQRDKDWLMLARLVENDIFINKYKGSAGQARWWLLEARLPETLARLCARHPEIARKAAAQRPLLAAAIKGDMKKLAALLRKEEALERAADTKYWTPLKKELEALRLARPR